MARRQLLDLGLSPDAVDRRVRAGRLVLLHRGVYAVGHTALGWKGNATAALLATGPSSVISHASAAAAWRILPPDAAAFHVTVPRGRRRGRRGIVVHASPGLASADVRRIEDVPVTAPARTLVDLAAAGERRLDAALAEAQVLRLVGRSELEQAMERATDRRGVPELRRALAAGADAPTRSELEREMLRLVREAGLPRPAVNSRVGAHMVDFLWPREKVVVETDGWAAHRHRRAFETDRARDAQLQASGYVVVRFTWRQLTGDRLLVASRLAQVLAARA